jgi:hypothetical protein
LLEALPIRIDLKQSLTCFSGKNLKPITHTNGRPWHKQFPDHPTTTQQMTQTIPLIEIAYNADSDRIRSPHRKQGSHDAFNQARMRAQDPIGMQMASFIKEMQIIQAQPWGKIIRVKITLFAAIDIDPRQSIVHWQFFRLTPPCKQVGVRQSPQGLVDVSEPNLPGPWQKDSDKDQLAATMAAQHRTRVWMTSRAQQVRIADERSVGEVGRNLSTIFAIRVGH